MFANYFEEMQFVAWMAMLGSGVNFLMLIIIMSNLSDIKSRIGKRQKPIDTEELAEEIADEMTRRMGKQVRKAANQPPPPTRD